jgi:hypothetical protein
MICGGYTVVYGMRFIMEGKGDVMLSVNHSDLL